MSIILSHAQAKLSATRVWFYRKIRNGTLIQLVSSIGDQGVVALTSLMTLAVLSRMMNLHQLGIVATALALWLLVETLQRSLVILPFIATCPKPEEDTETFGSYILLNALMALAGATALAIVGYGVRYIDADFSKALILAAPLSFCGSMFLFVRQMFYHVQHHIMALLNAILVAIVTAIGLWIYWDSTDTNAESAVLVISLGYLLPSFLLSFYIARKAKFSLSGLLSLWSHRQLMLELMAANIALHFATNGAQIILSFVSGPTAIAIFALARSLVRPLTLVIHAIVDIGRARLVRQAEELGVRAYRPLVKASQFTIVGLCLPPMIAILLFPGWILHLLYGAAGASAENEVRLWVLALVPYMIYSPMEAALTVLQKSRDLARINTISMGVMGLVIAIMVVMDKFSAGAAIATVGGAYLICYILVYRSYQSTLNRQT